MLLLLLLCSFDRSPFTRDLGELLGALASHNEGGTQSFECNFDIWISDGLKSWVDGLYKICRSPVWTLGSLFCPLLLEIPTDLAAVHPKNIFRIFSDNSQKDSFFFFLQHESVINISKDYLHLSKCFSRRKSGFDPFL